MGRAERSRARASSGSSSALPTGVVVVTFLTPLGDRLGWAKGCRGRGGSGNLSDTSRCRGRASSLGTEPHKFLKKREEQIGTRQDESQWIVAQRPLSAPTIPRFDWIVCPGFPRSMMWTSLNTDSFNGLQGTCDIRPKPFTFVPVLMERKTNTVYQHGF